MHSLVGLEATLEQVLLDLLCQVCRFISYNLCNCPGGALLLIYLFDQFLFQDCVVIVHQKGGD